MSTTAPAAQRAAPRMTLASVRRGLPPAPDRLVIYGTDGVGKSTFAASFPGVVFLAAEDGLRHLGDVATFPEPRTFADVQEAIASLTAGGHPYRWLAIDTADWVEPLLWREVCRRNSWADIETPGYGKGYTAALDDWRTFIATLDRLRDQGVGIIVLAHAQVKQFNNPAGPDFSRYELAIDRKAAALFKQWSDATMFATYEEFTKQRTEKDKAKAVATGRRILHTERTAAWDAKNRLGLPGILPLDYESYAAARAAGQGGNLVALCAEFEALLEELNPPAVTREHMVRVAGDRTDAQLMARCVNKLRSLVAEKE